ncbi:hypothetical protein [Methanoplanus limicola]|nr:hypothetical protein [Methanoplanus limicola]
MHSPHSSVSSGTTKRELIEPESMNILKQAGKGRTTTYRLNS